MSTTKVDSMSNAPPTDIIKLLRSMFEISNQHLWVADFLFTRDVLSVSDLVSDLQKASSAILSVHVKHLSGKIAFLEKVALVPVFSNGCITTGVLVKNRDSDSNSMSRSSQSIKARIAFNNKTTSFLAVYSPTETGTLQFQYVSNRVQQGIRVATLEVNESVFRSSMFNGKVSASLLMNSLKRCECYYEERFRCIKCSRRSIRKCPCTHSTYAPKHPLDFNSFAANLVLLSGELIVNKISWKGSGNGLITDAIVRGLQCKTSVVVDEVKVSKLCKKS